MEKPDRKQLTGKMKKWADAYLATFNKTEAARQAGYGGTDADLANIGYQNYRKLEIQAYMKEKLDEMAMSAEEALARLGDMASASHADFADVQLREDLKGHPKAHLVKTISTDVYEDKLGKLHHKLRIELHDAQSAIINVLKVHGKFKETTTNLNLDLSQLTNEQLQRIAAGEDASTVLANPTQSGG